MNNQSIDDNSDDGGYQPLPQSEYGNPRSPAASATADAVPVDVPVLVNNTTSRRNYDYVSHQMHGESVGFIRESIVLALLCIIILGIFLYSAFSARNEYHDPKFQVESLAISSFNIVGSQLTAIWDIEISVGNRNTKKNFTYQYFEVSVFHHTQWKPMFLDRGYLLRGEVAPFGQPPRNETLIHAKLSAHMLNISDWKAKSMTEERAQGDEIDLDVYIQAQVRSVCDGCQDRTRLIVGICRGLKIGFDESNVGKMSRAANNCYTSTWDLDTSYFPNPIVISVKS